MKTHSAFFNTPRLAFLAMVACVVSSSQAQAAPPAGVNDANAAAKIYITVPASGSPATFMVGDQKTTVAAGATVNVPAGSTSMVLPKGTVITASATCAECGGMITLHYTVTKDITVAGLNPQSFASNSKSFKPGLHAGSDTGEINFPAYLTSKPCTCKHRGNGQISLPSATIANLIKAVLSASGRTVNPFNVLGHGVTDGN